MEKDANCAGVDEKRIWGQEIWIGNRRIGFDEYGQPAMMLCRELYLKHVLKVCLIPNRKFE